MDLDHHEVIAWDFDNTLVDCPTCLSAQQYILDHPEKTHYIVTFRSHGYQNFIFDDLAVSPVGLTPANFAGVRNIPDRNFVQYQEALLRRKEDPGMPDTSAESFYRNWKAFVCRKLGATVLVDDDTANVSEGCSRYGIALYHPDQLF